MTTINKTQTDFLVNKYSYDRNNQIILLVLILIDK